MFILLHVFLVRLDYYFVSFLFVHVMFQTRGKRKCNVCVTCGMTRKACRGCGEYSELLSMC